MAVRSKLLRIFPLSAAILATGALIMPDVSEAGDGFGMAMGIMHGMMGHRGGGGGGGHRYRRHEGGSGSSSDNEDRRQDKDRAQAANENAALLYDAAREYARNQISESNRNVDAAIDHFIGVLEDQHKKLRNSTAVNVRAASGTSINQITEGEIRGAADKAYQDAHLTDFDTLAGELWTRDRLLVQILREAETGIRPYFRGVGAKGPDMNNLQEVFKDSATSVYARALELAEIVGVSRSFDRFIRTIYENSDQAPAGLQTVGADVEYERMLTRVINDVDRYYFILERVDNQKAATLAVRLSHQFGFRFRARRALYDCMAAGYVSLIGVGPSTSAQLTSNPSGSRGAQLDVFSRPENKSAGKPGKPAVVTVVESSDTSEDVWKRARKLVSEQCREITRPFAQAALDAGLKPISAREDLAIAAGLAKDRAGGQYMQIRTGEGR